MKAIHNPYSKVIGNAAQFVIPVFQRDYSWTEAECEQLWRDILRIADEPGDRGHFMGSVVYISTEDISSSFTQWLLIDGQQRVTTLSLLAAAMRDHIRESGWTGSEDGPTARKVENYFLRNAEEEGERSYKLRLRRHDQATLRAIVDGDEKPRDISERVRDNYELFRDQLKDADPEAVYRGMRRLIVVDVTLDRGVDDPQLIFESLNSTGMDLSQSDLIRNFILMRLDEKDQTRLYEQFWSKIEALFRGSEKTFDAFVRDYLALRTEASKQEKGDQIYFAFRREFGSIGRDLSQLEPVLNDLLRFARYHAAFSIGENGPDTLRGPLARLRHQVDVPATLVMRLFECHDGGTLSTDEFAKAIELIESYVFRRAICGEQSRSYWQIFANLAYRLNRDHPLESLQVGLARQREAYRFPGDEEFRHALEEGNLYGKRVSFDLLDRLENHGSKEPTDTRKYTIEHVMPQNEKLDRSWREMLGDNWREVQQTWLHRLGNLTLTGYNSTYSDRSFDDKKTIKGGFEESSVRLNKFVREQSQWTAAEMEKRGKELAVRSLGVWSSLVVDQALIEAADEEEMRQRARRRSVDKVPMSQKARLLFEVLRLRIREMDNDAIELAEDHSVSYHSPSFFLEVLPRTHRVNLLLAIGFNEIEDEHAIAKDAAQRAFFVNAQYEGGVNIPVWSEDDIEKAMPIVRQAHAMTSSA
jgi:predicted transport protein